MWWDLFLIVIGLIIGLIIGFTVCYSFMPKF